VLPFETTTNQAMEILNYSLPSQSYLSFQTSSLTAQTNIVYALAGNMYHTLVKKEGKAVPVLN
jgi:hypothetical protein